VYKPLFEQIRPINIPIQTKECYRIIWHVWTCPKSSSRIEDFGTKTS